MTDGSSHCLSGVQMREKALRKILVIEEQRQIRDLFIEGLKAKGFVPISAENGREGVQQARQHLPDLITCGIMIPDIDGYDVLTILRRSPATAVIPFIFVTAKDDRTNIRKAMELGADDYLTKPCTVEELTRAINAQFQKQNTLQRWYAARSKPVSRIQPPSQIQLPPSSEHSSVDRVSPIPAPESIFPSDSHLSEVFQFIEANYHRSITLSDVAQAAGYSPAYLTSLIGRQTGQTVQQWIIERRMAAARALLLETDQSVEQIAAQVGYHNSVHFFRQFRQIHGDTPNGWRSAQRQQQQMQCN
jgi:YesN/AraC family two-component response regulator